MVIYWMHYVCRQLPPSFPTHTCWEKAYKTNSIDTFRAIPPFFSHDTKYKSNTGNNQLERMQETYTTGELS